MSQSRHVKYSPDQVMMTLAAIAYTSFDSINTLQECLSSAEALEQEQQAIWWAKNESQVVYVAKNVVTEEYAVAIRDRVFHFDFSLLFGLYEYLDVTQQVLLPYSQLGQARIAAGLSDTIFLFSNLLYNGRTLHQVLNDLPPRTKVYITGHSLGGTLASVYAAKLACSNFPDLDIIPYTFGAPAAGNKSFADLFNPGSSQCLFPQASRCVNHLDTIPLVWQGLQDIPAMDYGPIKCPIDFTLGLDCLARLLILARVHYAQGPAQLQLTGRVEPNTSFFGEAMYQHQHNTYMNLLHLKPIRSNSYTYKQEKQGALTESL